MVVVGFLGKPPKLGLVTRRPKAKLRKQKHQTSHLEGRAAGESELQGALRLSDWELRVIDNHLTLRVK